MALGLKESANNIANDIDKFLASPQGSYTPEGIKNLLGDIKNNLTSNYKPLTQESFMEQVNILSAIPIFRPASALKSEKRLTLKDKPTDTAYRFFQRVKSAAAIHDNKPLESDLNAIKVQSYLNSLKVETLHAEKQKDLVDFLTNLQTNLKNMSANNNLITLHTDQIKTSFTEYQDKSASKILPLSQQPMIKDLGRSYNLDGYPLKSTDSAETKAQALLNFCYQNKALARFVAERAQSMNIDIFNIFNNELLTSPDYQLSISPEPNMTFFWDKDGQLYGRAQISFATMFDQKLLSDTTVDPTKTMVILDPISKKKLVSIGELEKLQETDVRYKEVDINAILANPTEPIAEFDLLVRYDPKTQQITPISVTAQINAQDLKLKPGLKHGSQAIAAEDQKIQYNLKTDSTLSQGFVESIKIADKNLINHLTKNAFDAMDNKLTQQVSSITLNGRPLNIIKDDTIHHKLAGMQLITNEKINDTNETYLEFILFHGTDEFKKATENEFSAATINLNGTKLKPIGNNPVKYEYNLDKNNVMHGSATVDIKAVAIDGTNKVMVIDPATHQPIEIDRNLYEDYAKKNPNLETIGTIKMTLALNKDASSGKVLADVEKITVDLNTPQIKLRPNSISSIHTIGNNENIVTQPTTAASNLNLNR